MTAQQHPLPAWIYRQSASLPYRWSGDELQVLLITSRSGKRWIVPKGIVEPGLTAQASAAKETLEEAGVRGDIADLPLGTYRRPKWGGTCEVRVYPLLVSTEYPTWAESSLRLRRWMSISQAVFHVEEVGLRNLIARLRDAVSNPATLLGELRTPESPSRLVYLMRHAEAHEAGTPTDLDRALTPGGLSACLGMHRYLSMADVRPDLVLCSTARRARQTLDAVVPVVGARAEVAHLREVYDGGPEVLMQLLQDTEPDLRRVMVVGHNPALRRLMESLAGELEGADPKCFAAPAIAILEFGGETWSDLEDGSCRLHSLVAASDLAPVT